MAKITLIAAMASNRIIGKKNKLPWQWKSDLQFFRMMTLGHTVVMGRKTFESIGKPLEGRINIVLTRNPNWTHPGVLVVNSVVELLAMSTNSPTIIFIIGGSTLYEQFMSHADEIILTTIQKEFDGDAMFPPIREEHWQEVSHGVFVDPDLFGYTHTVYECRGYMPPHIPSTELPLYKKMAELNTQGEHIPVEQQPDLPSDSVQLRDLRHRLRHAKESKPYFTTQEVLALKKAFGDLIEKDLEKMKERGKLSQLFFSLIPNRRSAELKRRFADPTIEGESRPFAFFTKMFSRKK